LEGVEKGKRGGEGVPKPIVDFLTCNGKACARALVVSAKERKNSEQEERKKEKRKGKRGGKRRGEHYCKSQGSLL